MKEDQIDIEIEDIIVKSNYTTKRKNKPGAGRKKHPLRIKYWGLPVSRMAIGHVKADGTIEYNELIHHPAVKRIMKKHGYVPKENEANKVQGNRNQKAKI